MDLQENSQEISQMNSQLPQGENQLPESQVLKENVPEIPVEKVDGGIETRD